MGTFFSSLDVSWGTLDHSPAGSVQKYPKSAECETRCNGKWHLPRIVITASVSSVWVYFPKKGLATSTLTARGRNAYVAVLSDGNPVVLSNVGRNNTISVDPDAVICWIGNGHCDPSVTADVSWKTFIGQTSGESYQFEWHGGDNVTVIIQPSERQSGIRVSMD